VAGVHVVQAETEPVVPLDVELADVEEPEAEIGDRAVGGRGRPAPGVVAVAVGQGQAAVGLEPAQVERVAVAKGGALHGFAEREAMRLEHGVPVRRFGARLGIPSSTLYHWRAGELSGGPVRRWPAPVVDAIEADAATIAPHWDAWANRKY
jgi:hypothetical protein